MAEGERGRSRSFPAPAPCWTRGQTTATFSSRTRPSGTQSDGTKASPQPNFGFKTQPRTLEEELSPSRAAQARGASRAPEKFPCARRAWVENETKQIFNCCHYPAINPGCRCRCRSLPQPPRSADPSGTFSGIALQECSPPAVAGAAGGASPACGTSRILSKRR